MDKLGFLSFEIGLTCNMAKHHPECPINHKDRYDNLPHDKTLTDTVIVNSILAASKLGFAGHAAFHFYNEPLIEITRIKKIIARVHDKNALVKFVLWTNGLLIHHDECEYLRLFDKIVITNYTDGNYEFVKKYCKDVTINYWGFDSRTHEVEATPDNKSCWRPFNELAFDNYGNAHLCCIDFRGKVKIGNLFTDKFFEIAKCFINFREKIYGDGVTMDDDIPEICRTCAEKHQFTLGRVK